MNSQNFILIGAKISKFNQYSHIFVEKLSPNEKKL